MIERDQRAWVSKLAEGRDARHPTAVASSAAHLPRPGDVVITREARHPSVRYTIGRLDKHPQLSCASRDKALHIARTYAACYRVDIWERIDGAFTSIAPRGHRES